jgi:hypothetical protein
LAEWCKSFGQRHPKEGGNRGGAVTQNGASAGVRNSGAVTTLEPVRRPCRAAVDLRGLQTGQIWSGTVASPWRSGKTRIASRRHLSLSGATRFGGFCVAQAIMRATAIHRQRRLMSRPGGRGPMNIIRRMRNVVETLYSIRDDVQYLKGLTEHYNATYRREDVMFLLGQIAARLPPAASLQEAEFRIFSQNGEDGIIQHIIRQIRPAARSFIEFGVQNYYESNTRFLLLNNNWRGLVLDPDQRYIDVIKNSPEGRWRSDLRARRAMLTQENINDIFSEEGFTGDLGLLSIDVDGMDWHLRKATTAVNPAIVVIEYNRNFPTDRAVVVPYDPEFDRHTIMPSYYGASLPALKLLGKQKGYRYVGASRHRANAFFVREELAGEALPEAAITPFDRRPGTNDGMFSGLPVLNVATGKTENF